MEAPSSSPVLLPLVFGNAAAYLACGIIMSQAVTYHQLHSGDSKFVRAPIYIILLLNLMLLVVGLSRETKVVGFHWGDLGFLVSFHDRPEDLMVSILSLLITACCQSFLLVRSFLFTRALHGREVSPQRACFTASKAIAIAASFAFGCTMTAFLFRFPNYAEVNMYNNVKFLSSQRYPLFEMLWVVFTALADLLICVSMSLDLHRAKTGNRDSNSILQTVINVSLRNGSLLLLTALTSALLYFLAGAGWTDATLLFLPRLGTITVLSSISSPKEAFRAQQRRDEGRGTSLSNASGSSGRCVCGHCTCVGRTSVVSRIKAKARPKMPKSCRSADGFDEQRGDLEAGQLWTAPSQTSKGDGIVISTTSRIDVEEGKGLDAFGNSNDAEDRIGHFVRIEGPNTPTNHFDDHRTTTPYVASFPTRQTRTGSATIYDPDEPCEFELPHMDVELKMKEAGLGLTEELTEKIGEEKEDDSSTSS